MGQAEMASVDTENMKKAEVVGTIKPVWWLDDEQINKAKMKFLENYFDSKTIRYKSPVDNKYIDVINVPTHPKSKSAISKLWHPYKRFFQNDRLLFLAEITICVKSAVIQYKPNQIDFNWSNVNDENSSEHQRINGYIVKVGKTGISVLESLLMEQTNFAESKERSSGNINGFNLCSLDAIIEGADGEEMFIHETLGEESGLYFHEDGWKASEEDSEKFTYSSNYHKPHYLVYFYEWLVEQQRLRASKSREDHKKADLSETQIEYFLEWKDVFLGELVYGIPKFDEEYELKLAERDKKGKRNYSNADISRFNKEIRERYEKHYYKKFPSGVSFMGMRLLAEKAILEEAENILYQEPVHNPKLGKVQKKSKSDKAREEELSKWILSNFKSEEVVQDIVYSLSQKDLGIITAAQVSKGMIEKEVLYSFIDALGQRLHEISKADGLMHKPSKWYKTKIGNVNPKVEKQEDESNSDVYVYRNGELVEVIEQKEIKRKEKTYQMNISMPIGAQVKINRDDIF